MAEILLAGAPWGAAGRGAEAELLAESAMEKRIAALWQRAIGKMLLAGAPWRSYWPGRRSGRDTTGQERRGGAAAGSRRKA